MRQPAQRQRLGEHRPERRVERARQPQQADPQPREQERHARPRRPSRASAPPAGAAGGRRRTPSIAVSSGGSSSVPTSSRIAQSGSSRLTVTIPAGSSANGPSSSLRATRASSAVIARSAARPNASRRFSETGARGARAALAGGLQQHGGQPAAGRLALLGDGQRQRAPRPLADRARAARLDADLAPDRALERAPDAHRGGVLAVGPRDDPRLVGLAAGDVAEHDRGVDRAVGALRERARARRAGAAARGRDEHERRGQVADLEHAARARAAPRCPTAPPARASRARRGAPSRRCGGSRARAARRRPSRAPPCRATVRSLRVLRETRKPLARNVSATRPASARSASEPGGRRGNALPSSPQRS